MKFLLFLLLSLPLQAQNLVVNYGFEKSLPVKKWVPCDHVSQPATFNTMVKGWQTFQSLTPDIIFWDSALVNCRHLPRPHSGKVMLGAILYHPFYDSQFGFDYHEFVQGSLAKPMEKGKTYRISFWVYADDSLGIRHLSNVYGRPTALRNVQCNNFGFFFSTDPALPTELFHQSIKDFEIRPQVNIEEVIRRTDGWRKVSVSFKADKAYKYFVFGNFFSDAITALDMPEEERQKLDKLNSEGGLDFWKKTKRIAYYLFDDFAIVDEEAYKKSDLEKQLAESRKYTFSAALLFETGKSELKPEALPALDELAAYLEKNTTSKLEILGYADAEGATESNMMLSARRAEAVRQHLIYKKIEATRLIATGMGENNPVADNATEAGRRQNRRVEVVLR